MSCFIQFDRFGADVFVGLVVAFLVTNTYVRLHFVLVRSTCENFSGMDTRCIKLLLV